MSLLIFADETSPPPRAVTVQITCDGEHGLFEAPVFCSRADYPAARSRATREGWAETGGRFLCPQCTGRSER